VFSGLVFDKKNLNRTSPKPPSFSKAFIGMNLFLGVLVIWYSQTIFISSSTSNKDFISKKIAAISRESDMGNSPYNQS
jgi:hypothetical protein